MQRITILAAVLFVVIIVDVNASVFNGGDREFDVLFRKKPLRRGGCSAFGHSCFGGHGKRSYGPQLQLNQRFHQRPPNPDVIRQWIQAYRGSSALLDGQ